MKLNEGRMEGLKEERATVRNEEVFFKEPICVEQEGDQGEESGDEAEDSEHPKPDHRKVLVLV